MYQPPAQPPSRAPLIIVLIVAIGLFGFTSLKLRAMAQIRGWIDGATVKQETITQKYVSGGRYDREAYWISWTDDDITEPGNHRDNLEYEQWAALAIGDPVEIVYANGGRTPNMRGGIYDSDGSFIINGVLAAGELAVIITMIVLLYRRSKRAAGGASRPAP